MTTIVLPTCTLRPWRKTDAEQLVAVANDADVARFMHDRFPYPYTIGDAYAWLLTANEVSSGHQYAIEVDGDVAGGIGCEPRTHDLRHSAHIGYWLGKKVWGRGIATAACRAVSDRAFSEGILRLDTMVFDGNVASMRVLEKCGYEREGILRKAILKRGELLDAYLYAKIKP